ncbi:hypothetical protein [Nonomuraea basaltis]|uniref:hypothetical protein n=1 Tax=Nonomuraea basaltis TaxID=2495887 RepID=UPI00110C48D2|nr:hypothetical protein [Nonomuraea basaltis]TMR88673.1 hypothetical protein EJK15_64985 [Nonomuraea basaltis]
MLKRLLLTASLMASTFFVTGAVTTPAVNADTCASSAQQTTADSAKKCTWKWWGDKYCYFCKKKHGSWKLQYCKENNH